MRKKSYYLGRRFWNASPPPEGNPIREGQKIASELDARKHLGKRLGKRTRETRKLDDLDLDKYM
jgi:hypothetical protein